MEAPSINRNGADRSSLPADSFDYSGLPAEVAKQQQDRAVRIISMKRRTVELMSEIGRELMEAQAAFEHGTFLRWVEEATHLSRSSAYRFMDVYKVFGAILPIVRNLPPTIVQALAAPSTPELTRAAVLKRLKEGRVIKSDVVLSEIRSARKMAREAAGAEREAARRDAMTPEQRQEEDQTRAESAKARRERDHADNAQQREIATFFLTKIGVDDLVGLRTKFGFSKMKAALWEASSQALVQKAAQEPSIDLSASMLVPLDYYLENYREPEIATEVSRIAELIKIGEQVRAITVVKSPFSSYYDIISGHLTFLALTKIIGRTTVPVQVAPASGASAPEPEASDMS